jgi:hypothetical protein
MKVIVTYFKILFRQSTLMVSREDQLAYSNGNYNPFKPRYKVRLTAFWLTVSSAEDAVFNQCRLVRKSP